MNYILAFFFSILRKAPKNRLLGVSIMLTFPVSLIIFSIASTLAHYFFPLFVPASTITMGIAGVIIAILTNKILNNIYQIRGEKVILIANKLNKLVVLLSIFVTFILYIISVVILLISLKYWI